MLVERQVGDQGFQLAILFAQLSKLAQLVQGKPSVFPLPAVKRLLGHAHFPANIADLLPRLDLPQGQDDLLFAMPFSRHSSSPRFRSEDHIQAPVSTFPLSHFRVLGQRTGAQLTGCLNLRGRSERQSVPNAIVSIWGFSPLRRKKRRFGTLFRRVLRGNGKLPATIQNQHAWDLLRSTVIGPRTLLWAAEANTGAALLIRFANNVFNEDRALSTLGLCPTRHVECSRENQVAAPTERGANRRARRHVAQEVHPQ